MKQPGQHREPNVIRLEVGGALTLYLAPPPTPAPEILVYVTARYGAFVVKGEGNMAFTLPVGMQVQVQVGYADAAGNVATVDGDVVWTSSDDNIATVTVDPSDSTMCTISATQGVGAAQVTATADADMGAGTTSLVTLLDLTVVAGEAVAGTISIVGAPTPIPPATQAAPAAPAGA
jgi:hypothetical protein